MDLATPAIIPALLTPFRPDGTIDADALRAHVGWLISERVDGLMPCGTTGETALLSDDEVIEVVEATVAAADGRVPVIAHVGRPGTLPTIELGRRALDAGAAAVSAVVPYYHPLERDLILDHYRALMEALGGERVLAYCIPSHSNNVLDPRGLATLAHEGLAGFKDSTLDAGDHDAYVAALSETRRDDFLLLVGLGAILVRSPRAGPAGGGLGGGGARRGEPPPGPLRAAPGRRPRRARRRGRAPSGRARSRGGRRHAVPGAQARDRRAPAPRRRDRLRPAHARAARHRGPSGGTARLNAGVEKCTKRA